MNRPVILCVDDENIVLDSLRNQLNRHFGNEYLIEIAQDAEEAIEILQELEESEVEVPVVISDHIMPGMKGDEFLIKIHKRYPKTLSILLTGQASTEAIGNALNGAKLYRYIAKPWEQEDLRLTIQEATRSYFQAQQLENKNKELEEMIRELETVNQDLKDTQQRLLNINQIVKEVSSTLSLQQVSNKFIEKVVQTVKEDGSGSILLYNKSRNSFTFCACYGLDPQFVKDFEIEASSDTLYTHPVLESQKGEIIGFDQLEPFQNEELLNLHYGRRFFQQLVTPMVTQNQVIGLVTLSNYSQEAPFTERDLHSLENLTQNLAGHFENSLLYENLENLVKERTQALEQAYQHNQSDLELAGRFQRAVLPSIPEVPYLKIVAKYYPLDQVSGDVYDLHMDSKGALNIFLGDAIGHGIAAAFVTMMVHIGLDTLNKDLPVDQTMATLNEILAYRAENKFVTGVFIRVTPEGKLTVAHAGHPPLLLLPADGSEMIECKTAGIALGAFSPPEIPFEMKSYQLQEGDQFFIYTDGWYEWENKEKRQFGRKRFLAFLEENRNADLETILNRLLETLHQFSQGEPNNDDMTLLGFQYIK